MGIQNGLKVASSNRELGTVRAILKFRNRQERRFLAQAFDISSGGPIQLRCELINVHVRRERNFAAAATHDFRAVRRAGFRERKDIVKSAAAQECRFDALGTVRGRKQQYTLYIAQIVNFPQELA
jgi:hypothetical protein